MHHKACSCASNVQRSSIYGSRGLDWAWLIKFAHKLRYLLNIFKTSAVCTQYSLILHCVTARGFRKSASNYYDEPVANQLNFRKIFKKISTVKLVANAVYTDEYGLSIMFQVIKIIIPKVF